MTVEDVLACQTRRGYRGKSTELARQIQVCHNNLCITSHYLNQRLADFEIVKLNIFLAERRFMQLLTNSHHETITNDQIRT
jgi:hypothetical protein